MAVLYDQFGRPIPSGIRKPELRDIALATIRDRWSGYPSSGLTPTRLASIFREADNGDVYRQAELFEEMEEKDAHLFSCLQTRKLAVQGLDWQVLPKGDDARAQRIAEFCSEALDALENWDDHVLDLLDAVGKGYSMMEILWDVSGGEVVPAGLRWIHPKRVTFAFSMTPRILTEDDMARGIDPPPFKTVYHRYKARSGYDTRAGILRVCAWMYLFKNYDIKDWVAFAEVYGMPLRVGKYEPGASKEDKQALIAAIRGLASDAAAIISKATEIEFVESQKQGSINVYESLANFCDTQMSKAILGQTLTSDSGDGRGSYALGKVHADVRKDLVEADAKALAKTIRAHLIRPMVGFNFGWDAPVPRFRILYEPPEDLQPVAETYKTLVDMGQPISREHVSERFKVPLPADGETPLSPPGAARQPTPPPVPAKASVPAAAVAGGKPDPGPEDAADVVAAQLAGETAEALERMTERVRAAMQEASDLDDLAVRLADLAAESTDADLAEVIAKAFALSDLAGRYDALEDDAR